MTPANGQPADGGAVAAGDDTAKDGAGSGPEMDSTLDPVVLMSVELIVALALWTLVGRVADALLSTGPWLTVLGAVLGWTIGLTMLRRRAASAPAELDASPAEPSPPEAASAGGRHAG